jgi:hypothetical protein
MDFVLKLLAKAAVLSKHGFEKVEKDLVTGTRVLST